MPEAWRHPVTWPAILVLILLDIATGSGGGGTPNLVVRMQTLGHSLSVNPGETVRLVCVFELEPFNLFDNPVLWRKAQGVERSQINIMGNLVEPFASTRRFRVGFVADAPVHTLSLTVEDVAFEDTGNYTCEVYGPQNVLLANVTHNVIVEGRLERITLTSRSAASLDSWLEASAPFVTSPTSRSPTSSTSPIPAPTSSSPVDDRGGGGGSVEDNDGGNDNDDEDYDAAGASRRTSRRSFVFTDGRPGTLRCLAVGHATPLELRVSVGRRNASTVGRFRSTQTIAVGGRVGLRLFRYGTELTSDDFRPTPDDTGKKITCTAYSEGEVAGSTNVRLILHHAPQIDCEPAEAYVDDISVFVRCEIRARPQVSQLHWIIDGNGTAITEGELVGGYWTIYMKHPNGVIETQLYIRRATPETFRSYELVAENSVAVRRQTVQLSQKYRSVYQPAVTVARKMSPQIKPDVGGVGPISSLVYFTSVAHSDVISGFNCRPIGLSCALLFILLSNR